MIRRTPLPSTYHSQSPAGGEERRGEQGGAAGGLERDGTLEPKDLNAFQTTTVQQCRFLRSSATQGSPAYKFGPKNKNKKKPTERLADAERFLFQLVKADR